MGEKRKRYVARAKAGHGWQIICRKNMKLWGKPFAYYPEALLEELNGAKRPEKIVQLERELRVKCPH